jgi:alpha-L-fucosidase
MQPGEWTPVIVAAIAAIPATIAAVYSRRANKQSSAVNKAVNNRAPHEPTIYTLVEATHTQSVANSQNIELINKWRKSYENSPWNDGEKVNDWLERNDTTLEEIRKDLVKLNERCQLNHP